MGGTAQAEKGPSNINCPGECLRVNKGLLGAFDRQKKYSETRPIIGGWGGQFFHVISLCRLSDFTERLSQSVMLCNSRYSSKVGFWGAFER